MGVFAICELFPNSNLGPWKVSMNEPSPEKSLVADLRSGLYLR